MPYGIQVYNASGNLIINEEYSNYHVISTGTIANGGFWPPIGTGEILFVRASNNGAIVRELYGYFPPSYTLTDQVSVSSGVVEYVLVKRSPSPSSASYGLRVYKANGSISFDSGANSAKIISSATRQNRPDGYAEYWNITMNQPVAVPAGRKRYISAYPFYILSSFYFDPFGSSEWGYNRFIWTSDMQQTVGYPDGPLGADWIGTIIIVTIDI